MAASHEDEQETAHEREQEPETRGRRRESGRTRSLRLADLTVRVVRAGTEAVTDVGVGVVRVGTNFIAGVAQSCADNVNATIAGGARVAQHGINRFFEVLDTARDDAADGDADESRDDREQPAGSAPTARRGGRAARRTDAEEHGPEAV